MGHSAPLARRAATAPGLPEQQTVTPYWSLPAAELLTSLGASAQGLSADEAARRLERYGPNVIQARQHVTAVGLLLRQFKNALVLILLAAAIVSALMGEWTDAIIVLAVVLGSTLLGFVQEYRAGNAVEKLRSRVTLKSSVLRDGQPLTIPSEEVAPGDVVLLSAGSLVPGDGVVLEANDFFLNQAVLTGETFPVEKAPGVTPAAAGLTERTNCVFMGTSVRSGFAHVLIVQTGKATVFGQVAQRLGLRPPETDFERGVRRFGTMLTQIMAVMVIVVLAFNLLLAKPPIDSILFALALAVGLTPELLPAIITITLSRGAQRMAQRGVIVRRLNSIENFGSMDVLCTDKTGTLTVGSVELDGALDVDGDPSPAVLRYATLNARFQTGLNNTLDEAIQAYAGRAGVDIAGETKVDEIPYDFVRKRLTVVTADAQGERTLITKGALEGVLGACDRGVRGGDILPLDDAALAAIMERFAAWSAQGHRVLGVAMRPVEGRAAAYTRDDETGLIFAGYLLFMDPPKPDALEAVADLAARQVSLKIITGDNSRVGRHVAEAVGLPLTGVLTGTELDNMTDEALWHLAERTTLFAEVDPNQKERIILALRKTGHVVGYMGDGINDAAALQAADVGISVDTAVDVAKEAADLVLLGKDLIILRQGIDEGRRTFANTLKYVLTTISANFGNMFSMAGISVMLPFLPLLASQILLNNFLSDIPGMAIAGDNVDPEWVARPHRWNASFIRRYMVTFGLVSSVFDFATFGALLYLFRATPGLFRTGWFLESLLTELVIALVVRTRRVFFRSRPGNLLLASTVAVIAVALALPYLPFSSVFGFVPLPAPLLGTVIGIVLLYVVAVEVAKKWFYGRAGNVG